MKIGVVMPSYNQGRFIAEAIESVLAFSHLDIDLLVMDGGSTDETVSVLESFDDRIRWISEPDDGQSWAINEGFRRVEGDILCWLNSDDMFTDDALDHVLAAFERNPEVQFVYGRGDNVEEDGSLIGDSGVAPFTLYELIHRRNFLHQPSCFWTRDAWESQGGLVEELDYVMDWDLWIRLGSLPNAFVDQSLSKNRAYDANKTMSGGLSRWNEIRRICAPRASGPAPAVLRVYGYETAILWLRRKAILPKLQAWLSNRFMAEMGDRSMTGLGAHGAMTSRVRVTVGTNGSGPVDAILRLTPLSCIDPIFVSSTKFEWKSNNGDSGQFYIPANASEGYELRLPLCGGQAFHHLTLTTEATGIAIDDEPGIVAYLDDARAEAAIR